jgi:endogenous inhibitor of DNA gyrase (YacG/DUF329 family)
MNNCPSCKKPWPHHDGCETLCRKLEKLRAWARERRAIERLIEVEQKRNWNKAASERFFAEYDAETRKILGE